MDIDPKVEQLAVNMHNWHEEASKEKGWVKFGDLQEGYKKVMFEVARKIIDRQHRGIKILRQWLNEDRIADPRKMVTNKQIKQLLD